MEKSIARKKTVRRTIAYQIWNMKMVLLILRAFKMRTQPLFFVIFVAMQLFFLRLRKKKWLNYMGFWMRCRSGKCIHFLWFGMLTYNFQWFVCLAIKHQKVCGFFSLPFVAHCFVCLHWFSLFLYAYHRIYVTSICVLLIRENEVAIGSVYPWMNSKRSLFHRHSV